MATRIQLRRGTAAQWAAVDPILALAEPGFETDTGILRIGDGSTPYTSLEPILTVGAIQEYLAQALTTISNAEQRVIDSLSTYGSGYPRFSVNSALVDDFGEPIFLNYSDETNILTATAPIVYTTATGSTKTINEDVIKDCSEFANGTYNVFIDFIEEENNYSLILLQNNIFEQKAKPTEQAENDIWLNTAIYPNVSYIYQDETWVETDCVLIGEITISRDITQPETEFLPNEGPSDVEVGFDE